MTHVFLFAMAMMVPSRLLDLEHRGLAGRNPRTAAWRQSLPSHLRPPSPIVEPPPQSSPPTRDWSQYGLQQEYRRSGGILYKQSALTPREYAEIIDELRSLDLEMADEGESSFAAGRVGATIDRSSGIYDVLGGEGGTLCRLVNSLADGDLGEEGNDMGAMVLAVDVPIEVRVYEKTGAGMEWHVDDVLYQPEQVEVVLTLENSSDCCTLWKSRDRFLTPAYGDDGRRGHGVRSVQTTPNSALILRAGGVEHKVSPLRAGRRVILKMVFMRERAVMCEGAEGRASHHMKCSSKRRNKKKGRKARRGQ